jgi:hypothetical protein
MGCDMSHHDDKLRGFLLWLGQNTECFGDLTEPNLSCHQLVHFKEADC